MNIIITSGGTSEQIDGVRKITNMSTGQLGLTIFNTLSKIENVNIYFITSSHCLMPKEGNIIIANSAEEVKKEIVRLLNYCHIDYFIHSMAVSDYKTQSVLDIDNSIKTLTEELVGINNKDEIKRILNKYLVEEPVSFNRDKKLSSNNENMLILLNKNPKIINIIKEISPFTVLIGFKLLNKGSFSELEIAANKLIDNSNADYVIANDLSNITKEKHEAFVFSEHLESIEKLSSKQEIANFLYKLILKG